MRRILIETKRPWLHRGYMVVGKGNGDDLTKLRAEVTTIDDPLARERRCKEIQNRDPGLMRLSVSGVRPCS